MYQTLIRRIKVRRIRYNSTINHPKCYVNSRCPLCNGALYSDKPIYQSVILNNIYHTDCSKRKFMTDYLVSKDFNNKTITNEILSLTTEHDTNEYDIKHGIKNFFKFIGLLFKIPISKGEKDAVRLCESLMKLTNTKINIVNKEKLIDKNVIYICNHSTYYDFIPAYYALRSGFVAATFAWNFPFGKALTRIIPLVMVSRGNNKTNSVDKIREFMNTYHKLTIFPEGMLKNQHTLVKFRTGGFKTGHDIQPILIKYNTYIHETNLFMAMKELNIDVIIMDPIKPSESIGFSDDKIEDIRIKMSKYGGLHLSNVSNRDRVDLKNLN